MNLGVQPNEILRHIPVLATGTMMPVVMDRLDHTFTLHRLPPEPEREAFLNSVGPSIRGLAASGPVAVDAVLMDRLPALEIISNFGVGADKVAITEAVNRGIIVTYTPDILTEETADTAFGLLLMAVRELPQAERWLRSGRWVKDGPYPLSPGTLRERKVGILGLGRIGKAIARRCIASGLEVCYHGRTQQEGVPYHYYPLLDDMAKEIDTLICAVSASPSTYHLVNAAVLKALGPTGVIVNIGRGSVVDEQALAEALQRRTILAAGLDVFEHEPEVSKALLDCPTAVLLPHVGSASQYTRALMGFEVVRNLSVWFRGENSLTPHPLSAELVRMRRNGGSSSTP